MNRFKKTRYLSLIVAAVLVFCALTGLYGCTAPQDVVLNVLYTSDMHGYVVGGSGVLGLDTVAAVKAQTQNAILLDAGDFSHGKPIATLTKGADITELMSLSGYDAVAVGNHEFDYGVDVLYDNILNGSMSYLSSNIYHEDNTRAFTPFITLRIENVKLGIFGLTTLEVESESVPESIVGLEFRDPVSEAKKAVSELQKSGCKIIIALTHLGTLSPIPNSLDVAGVKGIDVVVDGHSHVERDIQTEGARLVSPGYYGTALGMMEISYNRRDGIFNTSNRLLKQDDCSEVVPSAAVGQKLNEITQSQAELLNRVIAHTPYDLEAAFPDVRIRETNLGDLLTDALRFTAGADFAIANGGGIRAGIKAGDITMNDVLTTLPYSNLVIRKRVTGAQLFDILEHAYAALPDPAGKFAHVSGLIVEIDITKAVGERIVSLKKTDGTPIQKTEYYTLAANSYIAMGGDSYPHLATLPILFQGATEDQALIAFMTGRDLSPYASVQNRIRFVL